MSISHIRKLPPFLLFLLIFVSSLSAFQSRFTTHIIPSFTATALAEEEDEEEDEYEDKEDEDDEEEYEEDEEEQKESTKTIEVIKEVIEYKPITETVAVTEEVYLKDSDGDILVDAIDPDPLVHQAEYFTDTDGDGVPNALDQFHDEDDFSYYEFETDDDNNGILDSYES